MKPTARLLGGYLKTEWLMYDHTN